VLQLQDGVTSITEVSSVDSAGDFTGRKSLAFWKPIPNPLVPASLGGSASC